MYLVGEKINFQYNPSKKVIDGVSLTVNKSETLSIVGPSGCGKSTLLRIISGILPAHGDEKLSGEVIINGQTADRFRKSGKLAFMFQDATLMPNLTVKENIDLPLRIKGIYDAKKIAALLQIVGLSDFADYRPPQLSGGMKTRVALARSFVTGPELLLLDEPFSALDIAWKSKLYIELEKLREQFNTTMVVVTHDVQEALLLSDEVLVMSLGGEIQEKYLIESSKSLYDRTENISSFMSEVYEEYFIPIQQAIMSNGALAQLPKSRLRGQQ